MRHSVYFALLAALVACGPTRSGRTPVDDDTSDPEDAGTQVVIDAGRDPGVCAASTECASGLKCLAGHCVDLDACTNDFNCLGGTVCDVVLGRCVSGADAGSPVDAGSTGPACASKYDCSAGEICRSSTHRCAAPAATCTGDGDCPRGEICNFSHRCEAGCVEGRDCAAPLLCNPQRFVCEACSLENPCPQGQSCTSGLCRSAQACVSAQDCVNSGHDGAICLNGKCDNCASHSDCQVSPYSGRLCAADGYCRNVSCSDADCQASGGRLAYCDTAANQCATRQCLADGDCTSGRVCDSGTFTCASPGTCTGTTASNCDAQCSQQGLSCNHAKCTCDTSGSGTGQGSCTADEDCDQGLSCLAGICSASAVTSAGAPCDALTCVMTGCFSSVDGHPCEAAGCLMGILTGGTGAVACL